jgi:uncharacterized membrane protein
MKNRGMILFSGAVVAALAAASFYVGQGLPAAAQVPIHWNAAGQINGYADKWTGLFVGPLLALIGSLIFTAISVAEPQQGNLAKSRALVGIAWFGALGAAVVVEFAQIATLRDWNVPVAALIIGGLGLFFMVLGNQLSKSRQMYMIGIRTPWTLADPDIWIATHRLGGKLMMIAGLVWLVAAACGWTSLFAAPVLVGVMMVASLVPVVYSYLLWRRMGRRA